MKNRTINNEDRKQWIQNDEGLYNAQRSSGLSMTAFIKAEKGLIDEVINNVLGNNLKRNLKKVS